MFGCGVRLPTSHGGMGSVVVLLLRARARLGSPRNGFWSVRIQLRVQKVGAKIVVFRGLGRVFKSGFWAFALNYMFKTWFKTGRFLMVWNQF